MLQALAQHFPDAAAQPEQSLTWNTPAGGMFLWARLPAGMNAVDLLPHAVDKGVAFVPGTPFYAGTPDARSMRLSFVTPSVEEIHRGVAALAQAIRKQQAR
jgi:2-aminoadipate transaminase